MFVALTHASSQRRCRIVPSRRAVVMLDYMILRHGRTEPRLVALAPALECLLAEHRAPIDHRPLLFALHFRCSGNAAGNWTQAPLGKFLCSCIRSARSSICPVPRGCPSFASPLSQSFNDKLLRFRLCVGSTAAACTCEVRSRAFGSYEQVQR
jgi:hypothetical protein